MKKIICVLLIFSFFVTLTACKPNVSSGSNPEENSIINEATTSNLMNTPIKKLGTVGMKVLTDITIETTSCEIELTYSEDEEVLWKKTLQNVSVINTRFNYSLLKVTENEIFISVNDIISCLSTVDGSEKWITETLTNSIDDVCFSEKFLYVVYEGEQLEPKVDIFDFKTGKFVSSVIFDDIDEFASPTTINVGGENIIIKDSNGNVRYFDADTFKIVQEKDYKYREVAVEEKLILKQANEASFPKTYIYSYEGYEIYFTISRVFEGMEEPSEVNYEEYDIPTVSFLGEKTMAYTLSDNTNIKCTYLYKDGLLYSLAVLAPEVYDPMIFYTITSAFTFK